MVGSCHGAAGLFQPAVTAHAGTQRRLRQPRKPIRPHVLAGMRLLVAFCLGTRAVLAAVEAPIALSEQALVLSLLAQSPAGLLWLAERNCGFFSVVQAARSQQQHVVVRLNRRIAHALACHKVRRTAIVAWSGAAAETPMRTSASRPIRFPDPVDLRVLAAARLPAHRVMSIHDLDSLRALSRNRLGPTLRLPLACGTGSALRQKHARHGSPGRLVTRQRAQGTLCRLPRLQPDSRFHDPSRRAGRHLPLILASPNAGDASAVTWPPATGAIARRAGRPHATLAAPLGALPLAPAGALSHSTAGRAPPALYLCLSQRFTNCGSRVSPQQVADGGQILVPLG